MGERDTVLQKPGYNGLCNYAQKITSCFGLDGKMGGGCGAGCRNNRLHCVFGMYLVCDDVFSFFLCARRAVLLAGACMC